MGAKAEAAYKPYLANVSCGKFMNTLLLLTLRRAKSLNTFRWNIRVELSRPVYKALHNIESLRHLHVRLQAGPSLHQPPPPLPFSILPLYTEYTTEWSNSSGSLPDAVTLYGPPPVLTPSLPISKPTFSPRASKRSRFTEEPPTIAGFKNLESLSVLDMDNLDIIDEIQACIHNSSSTLKKLKLSFSDSLAMQARRPRTETEIDSEGEEVISLPTSIYHNGSSSGPVKSFGAQEERKKQESVLGRIFGVERGKSPQRSTEDKNGAEVQEQPTSQEGQRFIDDVHRTFQRMAEHINGTRDFKHLDQQNALDTILKAAKIYVESEESKAKAKPQSSAQEIPLSEDAQTSSLVEIGMSLGDSTGRMASPHSKLSKYHTKAKGVAFDMDPDDIDVAAPEDESLNADEQSILETQLDFESLSTVDTPQRNVARPGKWADSTEVERLLEYDVHDEDVSGRLESPQERPNSTSHDLQHTDGDDNAATTDIKDTPKHTGIATTEEEKLHSHVCQYVRDTRGIALRSLSIHLIPIKASVLRKAIDFHTLKRITLLNVGEQKKFWTLMMKENNSKRLSLKKVFTDDVCLPFLQLISELDFVDEVFMLQRSPKHKPDPFAPNPGMTLEQINKFVLRKRKYFIPIF